MLDQRAIITAQHLPRVEHGGDRRGQGFKGQILPLETETTRLYSQSERAALAGLSCHTQEEIAEAVNIPQRTISDWIEGFSGSAHLSVKGVDVQRLCPPKWSGKMSIQATVIPSDCDTRDLTLVRIMGGLLA